MSNRKQSSRFHPYAEHWSNNYYALLGDLEIQERAERYEEHLIDHSRARPRRSRRAEGSTTPGPSQPAEHQPVPPHAVQESHTRLSRQSQPLLQQTASRHAPNRRRYEERPNVFPPRASNERGQTSAQVMDMRLQKAERKVKDEQPATSVAASATATASSPVSLKQQARAVRIAYDNTEDRKEDDPRSHVRIVQSPPKQAAIPATHVVDRESGVALPAPSRPTRRARSMKTACTLHRSDTGIIDVLKPVPNQKTISRVRKYRLKYPGHRNLVESVEIITYRPVNQRLRACDHDTRSQIEEGETMDHDLVIVTDEDWQMPVSAEAKKRKSGWFRWGRWDGSRRVQ